MRCYSNQSVLSFCKKATTSSAGGKGEPMAIDKKKLLDSAGVRFASQRKLSRRSIS